MKLFLVSIIVLLFWVLNCKNHSLTKNESNMLSYASVFEGYNPYDKEFPTEVENLLNIIVEDLNVEKLNFSEEEIMALTFLYEKKTKEYLLKKRTIHLTAYLGKYILENYGGKWEMKKSVSSEGKVTWEPHIKIKDKSYTFIVDLIENLTGASGLEEFLLYEIYSSLEYSLKFDLAQDKN